MVTPAREDGGDLGLGLGLGPAKPPGLQFRLGQPIRYFSLGLPNCDLRKLEGLALTSTEEPSMSNQPCIQYIGSFTPVTSAFPIFQPRVLYIDIYFTKVRACRRRR